MPRLQAHRLASIEPQRQFNFDVVFGSGIFDGDDVTLAVESAFLPNMTNEEIELPYWNSKIFVAGKSSYESGTLTIRDFTSLEIAGEVYKWYEKVYDPVSGIIGSQEEYKIDMDLNCYGVGEDSEDIMANSWTIHGCWPTSVNFGTLDYTANDVVKIELTIRFDWAERKD